MSEQETRRERLTCTHSDPCAYDHTCTNHRILGEAEQASAQARAEERERCIRPAGECGLR